MSGEAVLPRWARLRSARAFRKVYRSGRGASGQYVIVRVLPGPRGAGGRLGVVVGRKLGKAVVRNKLKRWVRAVSRRYVLGGAHDIVVIVKKEAAGCVSFQEFRADLEKTLEWALRAGGKERGAG